MKKFTQLVENYEGLLQSVRSPILCWSGGKDSTFLLLLARSLDYNLPVLMFSHFWSKIQKEFIKKIIEKYEITAFFYRPRRIQFTTPYVVAHYSFGGAEIPVIFDHLHDDTRCGLDLANNALQGVEPLYLWKTTILGSKKMDNHELVRHLDFTEFVTPGTKLQLPLWDWTDQEVLKAMDRLSFEIPPTENQYETGNFIACMNCQQSGEVYCPKLGKTILGFG